MKTPPTEPGRLPLSAKALRTQEQPISFLITEALRNPRLINLAAGLVDPLTLPVDEVRTISQRLLSDTARGRAVLQYDTTLGLRELRQRMLKHMEDLEGVPGIKLGLTEENLVLSTGSQQALYLVGDALVDPGDIVIAANPSYFVYTGTLSSLGARVETVPMDDGGMDVEAGMAIADGPGGGARKRICISLKAAALVDPEGGGGQGLGGGEAHDRAS